MTDAIIHRGPDSDGHWFDHEAGIALGHRRLAIVDLSPAGAQPMAAYSGRWIIAFNGEIYNHNDLRAELDHAALGLPWRGHSDTETLLACFDAWGIEATIKKCVGMFAIAIWCRDAQKLVLVRDRLGEKPLYYGWQGTGEHAVFMFGSELKALKCHPAFRAEIDRTALGSYMQNMVVPGTKSIFTGILKVPPGAMLHVSLRSPEPVIEHYWSGAAVALEGVQHPFAGTAAEGVDALEKVLMRSISQQMLADVPLGALLSGGVDSSAVVALMQAQSARPIKTFSIGFTEEAYNEAPHARAVADHLGTEHTELYVSPKEALRVIPKLPVLFDEPFADSSQIPTFLVSEMTRQHVTVALSGDAGDELFSGYNRYNITASAWSTLRRIPEPLRRAASWGLTRVTPDSLDRFAKVAGLSSRWASFGDKVHKGARVMSSGSITELYEKMVAAGWQDPSEVVKGLEKVSSSQRNSDARLAAMNDVERMMALDMLNYLPDDILTKVDRAAMGVSLETRVPFLDHRVVEFAWSLPLSHKLRLEGGSYVTKWALRQVLYRHVPKSLIERPKMGFGIPIEHWLRGELRDWAEDLLSERRLKNDGYLNVEAVRSAWLEHLSGRRNFQHKLWCVLMFQAWLSNHQSERSSVS